MKKAIVAIVIMLAVAAGVVYLAVSQGGDVVVGSKHFTEQRILGEMVAQLIETHTDLTVERKIGLQGTKVCFAALREGDIDVYPEYTGTGLVNILDEDYDPDLNRSDILAQVREKFSQQWDLTWMAPLGFDNTYAFAMRNEQAERLGVETVSDLEPHADTLRPGFDHEFTIRPEWERFDDVYGFMFEKGITKLAPDLAYKSLRDGEVDLIDAFSTDGRIAAYDLRVLEDDKRLFPPYDVCLLVREETLQEYPQLRDVLARLSGQITPERMREMNYAVTDGNRSPAAVADEFLTAKGLK